MITRSLRTSPWSSSFYRHCRLRIHHRRTLIAAPKEASGPLMSRRSDRALPPVYSSFRPWARTLPFFITAMVISALGLFNYQKASSSIVSSTLYALRTSEVARNELGGEIYFRDKFPWIWGEMNQWHGRINISFAVKGNKGSGMMRFRSVRRSKMGFVSIFMPCTFSIQASLSNHKKISDVLAPSSSKHRNGV